MILGPISYMGIRKCDFCELQFAPYEVKCIICESTYNMCDKHYNKRNRLIRRDKDLVYFVCGVCSRDEKINEIVK